jgi:hypothetical protein
MEYEFRYDPKGVQPAEPEELEQVLEGIESHIKRLKELQEGEYSIFSGLEEFVAGLDCPAIKSS